MTRIATGTKEETGQDIADRVVQAFRGLPHYQERKRGKVWISSKTYPAGSEVEVVSKRTYIMSLMAGQSAQKPLSVKIADPLTVYRLHHKDHGVWMSTEWVELIEMADIARKAHGNCLVGGLGLGVVADQMRQSPDVDDVVVVEFDSDVIRLVTPFLFPEGAAGRLRILKADLYKFAERVEPDTYDFAFLDTWQGTGEYVWMTEVVPLLRLLRPKIKDIHCWQESVMWGQVRGMLFRICDAEADSLNSHGRGHYWVFRKACEALKIKSRLKLDAKIEMPQMMEIEAENQANPKIAALAKLYLEGVGTPKWEKTFGKFWDQIAKENQ